MQVALLHILHSDRPIIPHDGAMPYTTAPLKNLPRNHRNGVRLIRVDLSQADRMRFRT